jgi:hypothetical protein
MYILSVVRLAQDQEGQRLYYQGGQESGKESWAKPNPPEQQCQNQVKTCKTEQPEQ